MQINITLIIQALNFFITYVLVNYLFLKPAFNALENDEHITKKLSGMVLSRRATIDEIVRHQQERWDVCKEKIAETIPQIVIQPESKVKITGIDVSLEKISLAQERTLVNQVTRHLVTKMQDAI